ncbi:MAG TPA: TadE/TadG family type IV pilus assembly protein [Candidatus Sulfotelmatobacter sp.]|jgi:Flp pilus assembly protein TadG
MSRLWTNDSASQMVEFAVSLPLLIVLVVGIFDFSGAYTLKQKLANAALEGARAAAADPATDLANPGLTCASLAACPASVADAFQVVDNYLLAAKVSDCSIKPSSATQPAILSWSFTVSNAGPPPCALTLTINRGCLVNSSGNNCLPPATAAPDLIGTQVSIQYAYNWHFNTVVTVLVPSSTYAGTTTLKTSGVALNEN